MSERFDEDSLMKAIVETWGDSSPEASVLRFLRSRLEQLEAERDEWYLCARSFRNSLLVQAVVRADERYWRTANRFPPDKVLMLRSTVDDGYANGDPTH